MKKFIILLLSIFTINLFAQSTYVPDDNFEQALIDLGYDDVLDDYVLTANINTINVLDIHLRGIVDLTGIEAFAALTDLDCSSNYALSSIDVSQNTALTDLNCDSNYALSGIDVSQNTALRKLNCNYNNNTDIDVTQNPDLTHLFCSGNELSTLDLSQNADLIFLHCDSNQLTNLDISHNTALKEFQCDENELTNLDIYQNTALIYFSCSNNQLTNLDVSQNTALHDLYCNNNQITNLDVSQITALHDLHCNNNQITNLDVTQNTTLYELICNFNQLTNLDFSLNPVLHLLYCSNNQLTRLDIRNGHNQGIQNNWFVTSYNPNLTCIFVDDATWSAANWTNIDPASTFVETQAECDALIGIDDAIFSQGLNIFPNPTTGIITIESIDLDAIDNIYLTDILGQRIIDAQKSMQIDISGYPSGVYLLSIESKTGNKAIYKVIKE